MGIRFSSKLLGIKFSSNTPIANAIAKVADTPIKFSSGVIGVKYTSTLGKTIGGAAAIAGTAYAVSSLLAANVGASSAIGGSSTAVGGSATATIAGVSTPSAIATSTIAIGSKASQAISSLVAARVTTKLLAPLKAIPSSPSIPPANIRTAKQALSTIATGTATSQVFVAVIAGLILFAITRSI